MMWRIALSRIALQRRLKPEGNSIEDCQLTCRDLTENIFTKEVLEEHRSRFKAAKMDKSRGRAWSQCFIPEYFLAKIEGPTREDSAWLTSRCEMYLWQSSSANF